MWKTLTGIHEIGSLDKNIISINSILGSDPDLKKFIKDKEVAIPLFYNENNSFDLMVIIPVDVTGDQKKADNFINNYIKKNHLDLLKKKNGKVNLFEVHSPNNGPEFYYCFSSGFLFISPNSNHIIEALSHLNKSLGELDQNLIALLKTTNDQAQLNIFINHLNAGKLFSPLLSGNLKQINEGQKAYSHWTELDITIKESKIIFSGFTNDSGEANYFSNVIKNQKPGISKIENILPANTAFFSSFYISDLNKFFSDLYNCQSNNSDYLTRLNQQKQIESKTNFNLQKLFIEIFDGEIARSSIFSDQYNQSQSSIFTIKTKSGSYTLDQMKNFISSYYNKPVNQKNDLVKEFKIDNLTSCNIYKFPIPNLSSLLFGNLFGNFETNWFTVYNNYLIFSDSYNALGETIIANMLGETLNNNKDYIKYQNSLSLKYNYFYFCNTTTCATHPGIFFNEDLSKQISNNDEFKKFKYFSWQINASGKMIYNNSSILFDENNSIKTTPIWQSRLAAPIASKPLIVENKYDLQNSEIIFFDTINNVYLVNNVGHILWQFNAGSHILSDIGIIDLHDNGQHQFVFNTKEKLFIIDEKGDEEKNFPLLFKVPASNGVAIFDYEKNHNYRFFVAGEDQVIYAFDQEGNTLEGWQLNKTDHPVTKPIQHFSVEGKDYIVASDKMKDYIFDRKGNTRVKTDYIYQHSSNNTLYLEKRTSNHEARFVNTDSEGNIHHTYLNGNHQIIGFDQLDDNHYFIAANADDDSETEYIFSGGDHVYVQENTGRNLFNLKMNEKSLVKPCVFNFSQTDKKIGFTAPASNKIYLFNNNGSLYKGFPLDGCTSFNIGFINDDHSRFNVFVGSPDGYLYNYLIE